MPLIGKPALPEETIRARGYIQTPGRDAFGYFIRMRSVFST